MRFTWIDKQRLGQPLRGTFLNFGSPLTARMAAELGFDWLLIDTEHGACNESDLPGMMIAIEGSNCAPIVRVVSNNQDSIKRALDLGAVGVMIPYVSTPEEAAAAASYTHYPPVGVRGVASSTIATGFGLRTDDYHQGASGKTLTIVQIETREAVENADGIAAVDGVDVLFVGPLDLSFNLGCPKQFDHPEMIAALDRVVQACRNAGKACGILSTVEKAREHLQRGFTFIAVGSEASALQFGLLRQRNA